MICRQFRILLDLKSMGQAHIDNKTMAQRAGIPPFAVKKNLEQAAAFSFEELKRAIQEGVAYETDVKTGKLADQLAVELLIVSDAGRAAGQGGVAPSAAPVQEK